MVSKAVNTAYSTGGGANGIWRAIVQEVNGSLLNVTIPRLGQNNLYENVPFIGFTPEVGDRIWVGFIEGRSFEPVAFVGASDTSTDITEIVAGTNLNGGGTGGSITVNLDDDITLSTVTADFYGNLHGALHLRVKNVDSVALSQGDPVYATGAVGASGAVEVEGSFAKFAGTMPAMGLLDQDLAVNGEGHVVVSGVFKNFDTDTPGYSVGDELYVAPSGGLTTTRPTDPTHLVQKIAKVIRVQQTTGELLIQGAGRTNDIPNSFSTSGDVTVGGDFSVTGNSTFTGNLTVNGTTTTLNTQTLTVEDNIIMLNSNVTGAPSLNAGIEVERGTSSNRSFLWDESIDAWTIDTAVDGNLLRLTGANDSLNISVSGGDFSILNSQQSNGIVIYDDTGGVEIWYNGASVFEADSGGVKVGGSRILTVADEGTNNGLDADTVDGIQASSFLRSDAADTATGQITFTGNVVIDNSTVNTITLYTEAPGAKIADTFTDNTTYKSYIRFSAGSNSNDPGYIMHETSDLTSPNETNEGVLHLVPSDDNLYGDYVSIHGANNPDSVKIHTDGSFEGVASINGLGIHSGRNNEANKIVRTDGTGYIQAGWINTTSGSHSGTVNRIYASDDDYIRYMTPVNFRASVTDGVYATSVHVHPYLSTSGGTINGDLTVTGAIYGASGNGDYVLKVGDDAWIGDTDALNTIAFFGNSNDDRCTLQFGRLGGASIDGNANDINFNGRMYGKQVLVASGGFTLRIDGNSKEFIYSTSTVKVKKDIIKTEDLLGYLNERSPIYYLDPILYHLKELTDSKGETYKGDHDEYIHGFIAEDVADVIPEAALLDADGEIAMYQETPILALLVAEVKRLGAMVEEMYAKHNPSWVAPVDRSESSKEKEHEILTQWSEAIKIQNGLTIEEQ